VSRVVNQADHAWPLVLEVYAGFLGSPSRVGPAEAYRALARLPPRDARVVVLRAVHGLTNEEVGERLGVSRGMVDQIWHRALARLRRDAAGALGRLT
jgi:DNA-directed RNA polymerase specialized sigma24 family protein